ncbi:MAG: acyl carrier protein [Alphaproteobacteria bacterium]|nr:acyl carrier protein [Alphaproteobacteria bacterium]
MRSAHKFKVYDFTDTVVSDPDSPAREQVIAEIVQRLEPFQVDSRSILGSTVITKDLNIDSLAVMDMVMELEDRFDISIPLNDVAEIHTVDELADAVLRKIGSR